jgi:CGNR zinc finger
VPTRVTEMPLTEMVELVNEWGTLPRELDGRPPSESRRAALADRLHPVFAATGPPVRAALITGLLRATGVRPELAPDLSAAWAVDDPAEAPRAAAALTLLHHAARIGVCADSQCADVYVDASPAGRRRFCCLTCQNRARAAAFRARHRT